jgi:hypothetical protein
METFTCEKCNNDVFKETFDRLCQCRKCGTLYIPWSMKELEIGPSSYSIEYPEENKLAVNITPYKKGNV